ncbi:MAG TPA: prepilin-type N-terminal cleavage/methylation domain-containing protein [bacterium]|nr:prepilin-type N-terminal cleavage/methylation domain-containing protein [bacterium]
MTRPVDPHRSTRGFTLVEMVVAMAVFSITAGGIWGLLATQAQSSRLTNNFLQVQQNARYAMERFEEEGQWASGVSTASGGATPSVTFSIPANNPVSPGTAYTVQYALTGSSTITRAVNGGTASDVAANVTAFTLTYYDNAVPANTLAVANAGNAYRVTVSITATLGAQTRTFTSDVFFRNK